MEQKSFTWTGKYTSKVFEGTPPDWIDKVVETVLNFKELNKMDRAQHRLQFRIVELYSNPKRKEGGAITIDTDGVYDMTLEYLDKMLIKPADMADKAFDILIEEVKNNFQVILDLSTELMNEVWFPFFQTLNGATTT